MTWNRLRRPAAILAIARVVVLIGTLALLQACSSGQPVKVVNKSATPLTNVVVSGNGFSETFGTIPPGGAETVRIRPRAETGLRIVFEADGRQFKSSRDALEEDHLERAEITVNADHSIQIEFNPP